MRHTKQYHTPSQVLLDLTPEYPQAQSYLYSDEEYAAAAVEHLRFKHPLTKDSKLSNSLWMTYHSDSMVVIYEPLDEGVQIVTLMTKDFESLDQLNQCLSDAGVAGERLQTWSPTADHQSSDSSDAKVANQ